MWINTGFRANKVLAILDLNKSTYHYRVDHEGSIKLESGGRPIPGYSMNTNGDKVPDELIKEWIISLIETEAFAYGYRKLTICLERRYSLVINDKKVYRLCSEMKILRPQRRKKLKHPRVIARNREVTASNQLWMTDLKYGYVQGEDKFFYVLSYLDVYDREVVDYHIGLKCEAKDAVFTLKNALEKRGLSTDNNSLVIRSDNGPQFISNHFEESCGLLKLEHERIPVKTPNKNAHIESFHRLLEDECMAVNEFSTYAESYTAICDYMQYYNQIRIHSAIGYRAPYEYYLSGLQGNNKPTLIKI